MTPAATGTNFAATRLAAALAVLLGHSFVLAGATPPTLLGTPVHVLAVRVFFAISGYLVCASWAHDPAPARYAARRALRILPGLAAAVLLTVAAIGPAMTTLPLRDYASSPVTADYLWNLVLSPRFALPGVFNDGRAFTAANGSLWSLPVEVAMYLLLPLYARQRWLVPFVALAAIAGAVAFTAIWTDQVQPVVYATSLPFAGRFAADFVVGALVRTWRLEPWLRPQVALPALAATQLCAASPLAVALVSAVALPYAVLAFCLAPRPAFAALDRRADLSYGIYLWAGPIQQVARSLLGPTATWPALTALALPPTVAAAWLSWHLVEHPALRWKPARAAQPSTRPRPR